MNRRFYCFTLLAVATLLIFSCAKEREESDRELQEKILDAYIATKCPTAQKLPSGLTIIDQAAGTGSFPKDDDGCYIHYDTYSLDGTCQSTTDSVKARHLGTFDYSRYYGPALFILNESSTIGMAELLKKVNKGGSIKAIMPPWLTLNQRNYNTGKYKAQQYNVNMIYEIRKMGHIFSDLDKFQRDSLESYSKKYFSPKIDSLKNGYYFRNFVHTSTIPAADTVKADTLVHVWYIGRLLDGYVFDTNILDTAKKYRIYSSSNSYKPLEVKMKARYSEMISTQEESATDAGKVIEGFARALKSMTIGDNAVTFFSSDYGYRAQSTMKGGVGIPEYSMLRFDLWMGKSNDYNYPPKGK